MMSLVTLMTERTMIAKGTYYSSLIILLFCLWTLMNYRGSGVMALFIVVIVITFAIVAGFIFKAKPIFNM